MNAVVGDAVVDEIARRLDEAVDGRPRDLPDAAGFLTRGPVDQTNRLVVYIREEIAQPSRGGRGPAVQIMQSNIDVAFLLPAQNRRGGEVAQDKMKPWKNWTRRRLLAKGGDGPDAANGWTPEGAQAPLRFLGGRLEPFREGDAYTIWLDRYQVEWTLDSQRFNGA